MKNGYIPRSEEDYYQESIADLAFDGNNVQEFMFKVGTKRAKWASYKYHEEQILEQAKQAYSTIYKNVFHRYMYEPKEDLENIKIEKKNLSVYIEADPEVKKARLAVVTQENKIKFLDGIIDIFGSTSFIINNYIKHLIWQSGNDS